MALATDEPPPPRGRWRLVYDGDDRGFNYSVQPRRSGRRFAWPPPEIAWSAFTAWEAARSKATIYNHGGFSLDRLLRHVQIPQSKIAGPKRRPHTCRVVLAEHVHPESSPEESVKAYLTDIITNDEINTLRDPKELCDIVTSQKRCTVSSVDRLSTLPPEILDLILTHALHVHLDLHAFIDPVDRALRLKPWSYTSSERAILNGLTRSFWGVASAMPTFRVSQLLRDRTIATIHRCVKDSTLVTHMDAAEGVSGSARVRMEYEGTTAKEREERALSSGVLLDVRHELREAASLPLNHLITDMAVEGVWDFQTRQFLSPIKRLIGMESHFLSLTHIIIQCRIINIPPLPRDPVDAARWWDTLAQSLYARDGAYVQVASQVARSVAAGLWAALARRTGLWDGYCLRPTCTPHGEASCRARPPFMAFRMPIIDVELVPDLGIDI